MNYPKIKTYLSIRFIAIFTKVMLAIMLLTLFIDVIELVRRFSDKNLSFLNILELSILKQPELYQEILPFIILLASIIFFIKLSSSNELTILRSSGLSSKSIYFIPIFIIFIIFLGEIFLLNPLTNFSKQKYQYNINNYLNHKAATIKAEDVWFKAKSENYKIILNSAKISLEDDKTIFHNLSLLYLDHPKVRFINSNTATLHNQNLTLINNDLYGKQEQLQSSALLVLETDLSITKVKQVMATKDKAKDQSPNIISIISSLAKYQSNNDFTNRQQLVLLSNILAKLLSYLIVFLLAAYFCVLPPRYNKKTINITITIIIGFAMFFLLSVFYNFTLSNKISIFYGIWLPNLILFFSMLYLHIRKELGYLLWT
ncbi:MAG: LptF/LptG family permease [Alphaproteobacteria bacterium]|jgi:lipopolysaccharide export system permease protein|nr:LptF/LptG family permease [Alphaproteobacteria bacterium]